MHDETEHGADTATVEPDDTAAERNPLDDWATRGYDGPQPWEHDKLGVAEAARSLEPGQENTVTPRITHPHPILTSGSAHPVVHELGRKLAALGFPNSVSEGRNPFGAVDETILSAVDAFRSQHNVQEDPTGFGGNTPAGRQLAAAHLGPWTIEGILKAYEHEKA